MKIYKIARSFTDKEKIALHGVDPETCRKEFAPIHAKRKSMEISAAKRSKELGHELFPTWTPLNDNRCRKCAMTVKLPNILCATDSPNMIGAAVTEPCTTHLVTPKGYFNLSDQKLNEGTPLNRTPDETIV